MGKNVDSFVIFFDRIEPDSLDVVGGKCLNLAELCKKRFPVPLGFCITTAAYDRFLEENKISRLIANYEKAAAAGKVPRKTLRQIRALISESPLPEKLARDIEDAYRLLAKKTGNAVAVRSSATGEDSKERSFAGQHASFLCVNDAPTLVGSVKKCWASLWSDESVSYASRRRSPDKKKHGSPHRSRDRVAVIVQAMAETYVSGVMFTANPMSGNRNQVVINAAWGLGEPLVNGRIEPDLVIASKESGTVETYNVGSKTHSLIPQTGEAGGTTTIANHEKSDEACLDKGQIKRLVQLAKRIEEFKGAPQDIEWSLWRNEVSVLQARPITALKDVPRGEQWTTDNAQEACPGVISPLAARFIVGFLNQQFQSLGELFGLREKLEFGRVFDGYCFLNVTSLRKMMEALLPGVDSNLMVRQLLGTTGPHERLGRSIEPSFTTIKLLPKIVLALLNIARLPRKLPRTLNKFDSAVASFSTEDIAAYAPEESIERAKELYRIASDRQFLTCGLYGVIASTLLFGKLKDFVQELPEELSLSPSFFFTGLDALEDARQQRAIEALVEEARRDETVSNLILREEAGQIRKKLEELDPSPFKHSLADFLQKYGHLSDSVIDLMFPRWTEDPVPIFKILKSHLRSGAAQEDERLSKSKFMTRDEALATVNVHLKDKGSRGQKLYFNILVKLATTYVPLRENFRFHIPLVLFRLRKLFLRQGELLVDKGYLRERGDVFFLFPEEIAKSLREEFFPRFVLETVENRRVDHERWKKTKPPRNMYIDGKNVRKEYDRPDESASTLSGLPVCGGTVTGKARVLQDIADAGRLKKGEILVTRITDPSWTPLFGLAKGLVVDLGSMLSHGAIIARELGIPAVMGVRCGTAVIKDGEELVVDGTSGEVTIKPRRALIRS